VDFAARASVLKTLQMPDWAGLARDWPNGHLKLAWTRHLVRLRTELADVFTHGDYQPLQVSGPHRDHIIAFARRRGSDAAIVAVAKSFAVFTDAGRTWPRGDAFQCTLNVGEYSIDDVENELPLPALFRHLPAAVVRAKAVVKPARKRRRA
jgi:(1->4)-alpha-D-glucan 1-alpha-D-glucosylmutase